MHADELLAYGNESVQHSTRSFSSVLFLLQFCEQEFLFSCPFTFEFGILVSRFTRKDYCLFFLYLYTFHFLRLKQKMDSLLFIIKKHN